MNNFERLSFRTRFGILILVFSFFAVFSQGAWADTYYWVGNDAAHNAWDYEDGTGITNWEKGSVGSGNYGVPGASDNVVIDGSGTATPISVSSAVSVSGLDFTATTNYAIDIDAAGSLSITDSLKTHTTSGTLTFDGSGNLSIPSSVVDFEGEGNAKVVFTGTFSSSIPRLTVLDKGFPDDSVAFICYYPSTDKYYYDIEYVTTSTISANTFKFGYSDYPAADVAAPGDTFQGGDGSNPILGMTKVFHLSKNASSTLNPGDGIKITYYSDSARTTVLGTPFEYTKPLFGWSGAISDEWSNEGNWYGIDTASGKHLSDYIDSSTELTINNVASGNYPKISSTTGTVTLKSITLTGNATLTVDGGTLQAENLVGDGFNFKEGNFTYTGSGDIEFSDIVTFSGGGATGSDFQISSGGSKITFSKVATNNSPKIKTSGDVLLYFPSSSSFSSISVEDGTLELKDAGSSAISCVDFSLNQKKLILDGCWLNVTGKFSSGGGGESVLKHAQITINDTDDASAKIKFDKISIGKDASNEGNLYFEGTSSTPYTVEVDEIDAVATAFNLKAHSNVTASIGKLILNPADDVDEQKIKFEGNGDISVKELTANGSGWSDAKTIKFDGTFNVTDELTFKGSSTNKLTLDYGGTGSGTWKITPPSDSTKITAEHLIVNNSENTDAGTNDIIAKFSSGDSNTTGWIFEKNWVWTGATDTSWYDDSNWELDGEVTPSGDYPGKDTVAAGSSGVSENVLIPDALTDYPVYDGYNIVTISSLSIGEGTGSTASLEVSGSADIIITGATAGGDPDFTNYGTMIFTNSGRIVFSNGSGGDPINDVANEGTVQYGDGTNSATLNITDFDSTSGGLDYVNLVIAENCTATFPAEEIVIAKKLTNGGTVTQTTGGTVILNGDFENENTASGKVKFDTFILDPTDDEQNLDLGGDVEVGTLTADGLGGKTINFKGDIIVTSALTLTGTDFSNRLILDGSASSGVTGSLWTISTEDSMTVGSGITVKFLTVKNSKSKKKASTDEKEIRAPLSTGENYEGWIFENRWIWKGGVSGAEQDWYKGTNWCIVTDSTTTPVTTTDVVVENWYPATSGDIVLIPDSPTSGKYPIFDGTNVIGIYSLAIGEATGSNAELTVSGATNLVVVGKTGTAPNEKPDFTNYGTMIFTNSGRIFDNGGTPKPINDVAHEGTVQYGNGTDSATLYITDFDSATGSDYANLIIAENCTASLTDDSLTLIVKTFENEGATEIKGVLKFTDSFTDKTENGTYNEIVILGDATNGEATMTGATSAGLSGGSGPKIASLTNDKTTTKKILFSGYFTITDGQSSDGGFFKFEGVNASSELKIGAGTTRAAHFYVPKNYAKISGKYLKFENDYPTLNDYTSEHGKVFAVPEDCTKPSSGVFPEGWANLNNEFIWIGVSTTDSTSWNEADNWVGAKIPPAGLSLTPSTTPPLPKAIWIVSGDDPTFENDVATQKFYVADGLTVNIGDSSTSPATPYTLQCEEIEGSKDGKIVVSSGTLKFTDPAVIDPSAPPSDTVTVTVELGESVTLTSTKASDVVTFKNLLSSSATELEIDGGEFIIDCDDGDPATDNKLSLKNLTLDSGVSFQFINTAELSIFGDFTDEGTFSISADSDLVSAGGTSGVLKFSGDGSLGANQLFTQKLDGSGNPETNYGRVEFASDDGVTLATPILKCDVLNISGGTFVLMEDTTVTTSDASVPAAIFVTGDSEIVLDSSATGSEISVEGDFVVLGPDYDIDYNEGGVSISGLFEYAHADRPMNAKASYTGTLPDIKSSTIFKAGGITINVSKNFYANGATLTGDGTSWTLKIPENDDGSNSFAEAYNSEIYGCIVESLSGSGSAVLCASVNCQGATDTSNSIFDPSDPTSCGIEFYRPQIKFAATKYDDVVEVWIDYENETFDSDNPSTTCYIENTNNDFKTLLSSGKVTFDGGTYTKAYTDAKCTTEIDDNTDIEGHFFLKADATWNTDATGDSSGAADSTDRGGVNHKTTVPQIAFEEIWETVRSSGKARISYVPYIATKDECQPVLAGVTAKRAAHSSDASSQTTYDGHNLLEFKYSEPVKIKKGSDELALGADNIAATEKFGAITNSGDGVVVAGLAEIAKGKIDCGTKDSQNRINSIFIGSANKLSVVIAGFVDGEVSVSGTNFKNWVAYINEIENFSGTVTPLDSDSSDWVISDLKGNLIATAAESIPVSMTNATGNEAWDVTPPGFAPFRSSISPWNEWNSFSNAEEYEVVGTALENSGLPYIKQLEFHLFDNEPVYDYTKDSVQWYSKVGWCSAKGVLKDGSTDYATKDIQGGIRTSTLNGVASAFKYATSTSSVPSKPFSNSGISNHTTSTLFLVAYGSGNTADRTDDLYFRLEIPESGLDLKTAFRISYDKDVAPITDLAGNRLKSKTFNAIDPTPPDFSLAVSPLGKKQLFILVSKPIRKENFVFTEEGGGTISSGGLAGIPKSLEIVKNDGSGNPPDNGLAIDENVPAKIVFETSRTSGFVVSLNKDATLEDILKCFVRVKKCGEALDPLTGIKTEISFILDEKNNFMTPEKTIHAFSDFAVNLINPLYAYDTEKELLGKGLYGGDGYAVRDFSGSGNNTNRILAKEDFLMQVSKPDSVEGATLFMSNSPDSGSVSEKLDEFTGRHYKIWLPKNPNYDVFTVISEKENENFITEDAETITGSDTLFNFKISQKTNPNYSSWKAGDKVQFLFGVTDTSGTPIEIDHKADGTKAPLYALRLSDPNDVTSIDLWQISLSDIKKQRGNVSIMNNAIDAGKGEQTVIEVDMPKSGMLSVYVMTLDGNVLMKLEHSNVTAGAHFYKWNGKNNAGDTVARGIYFVRVIADDIDETRKVLVVK